MQHNVFRSLDHLAIVVADTEEALKTWRDRLGLQVLQTEEVNDATVRLTLLDLGNTKLQLVEPLVDDHPLQDWLRKNGSGLHHFCFEVEDVADAQQSLRASDIATAPNIHQGMDGNRALFLDAAGTDGVVVELTGN